MTYKYSMKKLLLYAKEFQLNDIIINEPNNEYYKIIEVGTTLLHNHKFIRARFTDESIRRFYIEAFSDRKRTVYRYELTKVKK